MGKLEKMFADEVRTRSGTPCVTCVILESIHPSDRKALSAELSRTKTDPKRLSARQIVDVLARNGIQASRTSVEKHRREAHGTA